MYESTYGVEMKDANNSYYMYLVEYVISLIIFKTIVLLVGALNDKEKG